MESGPSLVELLQGARGALVDEILERAPKAVPFYLSIPSDARRAIAARVVDLVLDQLRDPQPEAVAAWGVETYSRRQKQGGSLRDVLDVLMIIRRVFEDRVWESDAPAKAMRDVMRRIADVFDVLVGASAPVFEKNLAESRATLDLIESRYRRLYQTTPAMMQSVDAEGRIQAVSDRWLETLGYSADEVLGKPSIEFLTEASKKSAVEINIPKLREDGHLADVLYQFVKKTGDIIDVRFSSIAVRDERGEIVQFLGAFDDVTTELQATRALRDSEERWRAVLELSPLPLSIHREGVIVWCNEATVQILGAESADQIVGRHALEFVHPDDHATVIARMRAGLTQEMHESLPPLEERLVRLDGAIIYVEQAARPIVYEGKRATQLATIDVTARRVAEEARRFSEAQARLIEAQEEALRVLSTPLIPLGDGILVLPLVGRVNAERAERILTTLAEGVVAQQATFAIVDVTGMPEADDAAIEALVRATQVIRLLGAEALITGIKPAIASALVTLGADLGRITTRATVRDGIVYATTKRRSART